MSEEAGDRKRGGGVIGMYYGGQRRRRNARREAAELVLPTETLDEATTSPVIGFWMIPTGSGEYVKLKINESYQLGRVRYSVISSNRPFPGWALLANKKLLAPYARKVVKQVEATYALLTKDVGTPDWEEYMDNVEDNAKSQGWAFYVESHGVGWLGYSRGSGMIGVFGKEYFGKKYQKPESVKAPGLASSFRVDRGQGWVKATEEEFKKLTNASAPKGKDKKVYRNFAELLSDYLASKFIPKETDMKRVKELFKPAVVNQAFSHFGMKTEVAKIVRHWHASARAINVDLGYKISSYSKEVQEAIKALSPRPATKPPPSDASRHASEDGLIQWRNQAAAKSRSQLEGAASPPSPLLENLLGILMEKASFAKLLTNTKNHGRYKVGGMVKVGGKWTNDISIKGRAENARFVIAAPPLTHIERDGSVVYRWKFKSRADRSTTGKVHLSYLRILPKDKGIMAFLKNLIKGNGPWEGDCEAWCNCLDGEARVLMSDGTRKPIKDIEPGDRVFTHTGSIQTVLAKMYRDLEPDEPVFRIKPQGGLGSFFTTGDHPILTLRGNEECTCGCGTPLRWTRKCELSPLTMLSRKTTQGHGGKPLSNDSSGGRFAWTPVRDFKSREWGLSPWKKMASAKMDRDVAFLLGVYTAEGHISRGTVRITLNVNEETTVGAEVLAACDRIGYETSIYRRKVGNNWFDIAIRSPQFRITCQSLCPGKSHNKKLSELVLSWDPLSLFELVSGMISGDGSITDSGLSYFSSSESLISQFSTILDILHIRSDLSKHSAGMKVKESFSRRENRIIKWVRREYYQVGIFASETSLLSRVCSIKGITPKHLHRQRRTYEHSQGQTRVLTVGKSNWQGRVYDLKVAGDESFIVEGVAVHNCEDFRFRMHYANWKAGASHKPTGQNGDSTLAAPVKTNPKMIPLLCKHLVMGSVFLHDPPKKLIKSVEELQQLARDRTDKVGGYEPVDPKESDEMEPDQEPDLPSGETEDETGLDGATDTIEDAIDEQETS